MGACPGADVAGADACPRRCDAEGEGGGGRGGKVSACPERIAHEMGACPGADVTGADACPRRCGAGDASVRRRRAGKRVPDLEHPCPRGSRPAVGARWESEWLSRAHRADRIAMRSLVQPLEKNGRLSGAAARCSWTRRGTQGHLPPQGRCAPGAVLQDTHPPQAKWPILVQPLEKGVEQAVPSKRTQACSARLFAPN